jgi:hypothetical protein
MRPILTTHSNFITFHQYLRSRDATLRLGRRLAYRKYSLEYVEAENEARANSAGIRNMEGKI